MQLSGGTSEKVLLSAGVLKTFPALCGGFVRRLRVPRGSSHTPEHQAHHGCGTARPQGGSSTSLWHLATAAHSHLRSQRFLQQPSPFSSQGSHDANDFSRALPFSPPPNISRCSGAVIKQWGNCGNVVARGQPCPGSCSGSRPDGSWHVVFPQLNRTLKHNSWNYCTSQLSNVQLIDCLSL